MTGRFLGMAIMQLAVLQLAVPRANAEWPLWNSFAQRFLSPDGRVIDLDAEDRTTSEGQAYGMFFALVANDRERFDRMLAWTIDNLSRGDLGAGLPAWFWGGTREGKWAVLDSNAASDADLWLAYALLEAGRLWESDVYSALAARLQRNIVTSEIVPAPGFGVVLLPGPRGFVLGAGAYKLNPSYLMPQLVLRMARSFPDGPWAAVYEGIPRLWRSSQVRGFVPDWSVWSRSGFSRQLAGESGKASYDAIRVYLWAGMLHPATPRRDELLACAAGMLEHLRDADSPPEEVTSEGVLKESRAGVGFSAAVIPLLLSTAEQRALATQRRRLSQAFDSQSGLYGRPAKYYDQCLALFSMGWTEDRFRFGPDGRLIVSWRSS
jgi:endo-1,4-beta-D-glucanase Y